MIKFLINNSEYGKSARSWGYMVVGGKRKTAPDHRLITR